MNLISLIMFLIILNLFTIVMLFYSHRELKKEIKETNQWCQDVMNQLVEKENEMDAQLDNVIDMIKRRHNKVS